ncbi:MAG TPA: c-type cytochrome biogenesis protein CcmI [Sphingomonadales bacterium]|nr:c-type cytochrome biogenesis protein CcmI [Sphingomonadales bacterium]
MIWVWFLGFSASAVFLAFLPRLWQRFSPPDAEAERGKLIAFHRDELRRLKRDEAGGLVSKSEAARLSIEAERRLLQAAGETHAEDKASGVSFAAAIISGTAIALLAGGAYLQAGRPDFISLRPAARDIMDAPASEGGSSISELVAELEKHLQDKPGDLEGWMWLGNTYHGLGKFNEAASAYETALALPAPPETKAELYALRAEAFILMSGGLVSEAAKYDLARALAIAPAHPIARYYEALSFFQSGRSAAGLAALEKLYAELPAETPWRENLLQEIETAKAILGLERN